MFAARAPAGALRVTERVGSSPQGAPSPTAGSRGEAVCQACALHHAAGDRCGRQEPTTPGVYATRAAELSRYRPLVRRSIHATLEVPRWLVDCPRAKLCEACRRDGIAIDTAASAESHLYIKVKVPM